MVYSFGGFALNISNNCGLMETGGTVSTCAKRELLKNDVNTINKKFW